MMDGTATRPALNGNTGKHYPCKENNRELSFQPSTISDRRKHC